MRFSEDNHSRPSTPTAAITMGFPVLGNVLNGGQRHYRARAAQAVGALPENGTEVFGFLRMFCRWWAYVSVVRYALTDLSFDEDFIIDTLPEHDNVLLIFGLSGHGFKFASVLGEIATAFAEGRDSGFDLSSSC